VLTRDIRLTGFGIITHVSTEQPPPVRMVVLKPPTNVRPRIGVSKERALLNQRIWKWPVLFAALALWLGGCLGSKATWSMRYDARSDRFYLLTIDEKFQSSSTLFASSAAAAKAFQDDGAELRKLWDARERMIPNYMSFSGSKYLERSKDGKTLTDDLKHEPGDPEISWEKVVVKPGRLFKDRDGGIGYWSEAIIPGAVVDQEMSLVRARLKRSADIKLVFDGEMSRRAAVVPAIQPAQWSELSKWVSDQFKVAAVAPTTRPSGDGEHAANGGAMEGAQRVLACLDDQTLRAILRDLDHGDLGPRREGAMIKFHLPLTVRDKEGAATVLREYAAGLDAMMVGDGSMFAGDAPTLWLRDGVMKLKSAASMKAGEGLDIAVDIVSLFNRSAIDDKEDLSKPLGRGGRITEEVKTMAKFVDGWTDVKIEYDVDPAKLLAEFQARDFNAK
jgi:hypothetical protein